MALGNPFIGPPAPINKEPGVAPPNPYIMPDTSPPGQDSREWGRLFNLRKWGGANPTRTSGLSPARGMANQYGPANPLPAGSAVQSGRVITPGAFNGANPNPVRPPLALPIGGRLGGPQQGLPSQGLPNTGRLGG